jgi:hypothetical protein
MPNLIVLQNWYKMTALACCFFPAAQPTDISWAVRPGNVASRYAPG